MQKIIKSMKFIVMLLMLSLCFNAIQVKAQSPADDPGIGGVGSPTGGGLAGDGGPVVPLDRDLSVMLITAGIVYGYKKIKQQQLLLNYPA